MKILKLRVDGFMRVVAVEITPDASGAVVISGRNGQGKTSILTAIWAALGGTTAIPDKPIHTGSESASIFLDLGDITVHRTFKLDEEGSTATTLTVRRADGSRVTKSPQGMLDALYDRLSIDPLAFKRAKPAEQFDMVRVFVKDFDFAVNAKVRKEAFEERTDVNRDARKLSARIEAIVLPPGKRPVVEDTGALVEAAQAASRSNLELENRRAGRVIAAKRANDLEDQIEALEVELRSLRKKIEKAEPLPEPIDVDAFNVRIRAASEAQASARAFEERDRLVKEVNAAEALAEALTAKIETADREKKEAIERSSLPVPGLSLDDGSLTLNGEPFSQASDAEQLRASIAMAGAMAPTLRVIRVRDGSLLDKAGMALVQQYAEENDLQIWLECVAEDDGGVGFHIVDGHVEGHQ
jgi:DNA repair exonuclease SbcCD ATPase subunit